MASVFKKTVTRKLPAGAEIVTRKGEQIARWRVRGKVRTAAISAGDNGELRIRTESATYTAKYRDGSGVIREVATGCRDKTAAMAVLRDLTGRAERVKSGLLSSSDDAVIDSQPIPFADHLGNYLADHRNRGSSETTIDGAKARIERLQRDCRLTRLGDISAADIQNWLSLARDKGLSARTRNSYLEALKAFLNWCVKTKRFLANPLKEIAKADEKTDRRLVRRRSRLKKSRDCCTHHAGDRWPSKVENRWQLNLPKAELFISPSSCLWTRFQLLSIVLGRSLPTSQGK